MAEYREPSRIVDPKSVAEAVYRGIGYAATTLRPDVREAMESALSEEVAKDPFSREASVLRSIKDNADIGTNACVPICQDTGSVWVYLEAGNDALIPGDVFKDVPRAVENAYTEGKLRMSMVKDALFDRANTKTNNPAFFEIGFTDGAQTKLHVMLKGGGSDNASRVVMLAPGNGIEGIKREVLECVKQKAANACPPLIVGVGVGATFDKVGALSKKALLRKVGSPAESEKAAALERELLDAINETGIGAAALGGDHAALAVHVNTAPCHIAALPLAINMGCSAMRCASFILSDEEGVMLDRPVQIDVERD